MLYYILLLVGIVAVMFVAERAFTTLTKSSVDKKVSHEVEFYKKENARLRKVLSQIAANDSGDPALDARIVLYDSQLDITGELDEE